MARKARFNLPGAPQHIIQCGNNREPCFYAGSDYHRYLGDLQSRNCDLSPVLLVAAFRRGVRGVAAQPKKNPKGSKLDI